MKIIDSATEVFNGIESQTIFCLWTGLEIMSENRLRALWSIFKNTGRPIAFITKKTLSDWVLPNYPLHPAYSYLSSTHKSDYLRCYLMHHYGGGYTDIKMTDKLWGQFFSQLKSSTESLALGYRELPHGMPHLKGDHGNQIRAAHLELIGLCAFIFKPKTEITTAWYNQVNNLLDNKLHALSEYPGKSPLDQFGLIQSDGSPSLYPLRWAEILGEILHPILYDYRNLLIKTNIEPKFSNYR